MLAVILKLPFEFRDFISLRVIGFDDADGIEILGNLIGHPRLAIIGLSI